MLDGVNKELVKLPGEEKGPHIGGVSEVIMYEVIAPN